MISIAFFLDFRLIPIPTEQTLYGLIPHPH